MYDVIVVGAGVTGCFIAKELSKYELKVAVLDKKSGPGLEQTKGCSGIIHAFQLPFSSMKGKMCLDGNRMMDEEARELGFEFRRVGLLLIATNRISKMLLPLLRLWFSRHVEVREVSRTEILDMEPNVTDKVLGGLLFPSAGVVNPVEMTYAAYKFAKLNGVEFFFDCRVVNIARKPNCFVVETTRGKFESKFVVNCAGVYADEIARMVGCELEIVPGKGSHVVFGERGFASHIIAEIPLKPDRRTKGGGALVSIDGKPIWGPNLVDVSSKDDTSVTKEEVEGLKRKFARIFKRLPEKPIAYYAGVRSIAGKDFVINQPIRNFINVAGIQSPGLTAAPAIARKVVKMLLGSGLRMKRKKELIKPAFRRLRRMSEEEVRRAVKEDSRYGEVICLCNLVSRAEIEEVLKDTNSFDVVKHVTRAGMDCCKCHADIIVLMQRRTNKVVKDSGGSEIVW